MLAFLWRWRCPQCHKGTAIREGSFFAKSRLPLQKWLILLYWWATQYPILDAWQEAQVAERTAIQVYQWFCDVCSTQLLQTPIKLGGPGVVVQIDESLYCHKPKARNIWHTRSFSFTCTEHSFLLLQHHRGTAPRYEIWVFRMVDTSQTPALGYMQIVPDCTAATLLPIIQSHVQPGTIIHSDPVGSIPTCPLAAQRIRVQHR